MRYPISRREFLTAAARVGTVLSVSSLAGCWPRGSPHVGSLPLKSVAEVDPAALRKFGTGLQGQMILPGDPDYESARHVWNWAVDKHPGMIVRCAGTSDVVRAVDFARSNDLLVAVRAGGHSVAGKSTCDGGMVIDVSRMKRIHVDPATQIARVESGLTLGEFDHATQAFGLATTLGTAPPTGIAGLTTGGGLGWLMGKHGIALDNVREVKVVTADGRTLTANADENADLFWGVRGGGGNFGVITVLEYHLHPVGSVLGGAVAYPQSKVREVLRFYREYTSTAPDELTAYAEFMGLPSGQAFCIAACYSGDLKVGEAVLKPLRRFGRPLADSFRPMPYVDMQTLLDVPPVPLAGVIRANFLRELSDDAIDTIAAHMARIPAPACEFFLEHFHGAACRVESSQTAFAHRTPGYNFATDAIWPVAEAQAADASVKWVHGLWSAMQPFIGGGVYSNYLQDEGEGRVRAAYGANYERLVALKQKYDPTNFFRMNQNIKPMA